MAKNKTKTEETKTEQTKETGVEIHEPPLKPGQVYKTLIDIDLEQPEGSAENWARVAEGTLLTLISHDPDPNGNRNNTLFLVPGVGPQKFPSDLLSEYAELVSDVD